MSLLIFFVTSVFAVPVFAAIDPGQLLKESDRARGGVAKGLQWEMELTSFGEGDPQPRTFRIKALGDDALAESLTPSRYKGEVMLFNDRNMWFARPGLKKPVAISARQKLSGQAANGDIASTQYFRDYNPTLIKVEKMGGEEVAELLLKAKRDSVTYDAIRYWVSVKRKLALKAEFLNLQGKAFKKAEFEYDLSIQDAGEKIAFVSKTTITNSLRENEKSVLVYKDPKPGEFSPAIFNVNNLVR